MERTRSKAKIAKAIENWKRLQEFTKKEEPKLEELAIENISSRKSPPLKETA